MVIDGDTGLLVPADADALAAAILRLAAAPELGDRLAAPPEHYVVDQPLASAGRRRLRRGVRAAARGPRPGRWTSTTQGWGSFDHGRPLPCRRAVWRRSDAAWPAIPVLAFPSTRHAGTGRPVVTLDQPPPGCWPPPGEHGAVGGLLQPGAGHAGPEASGRGRGSSGSRSRYPDGVGAVWAACRQGAPARLLRPGPAGCAASGTPREGPGHRTGGEGAGARRTRRARRLLPRRRRGGGRRGRSRQATRFPGLVWPGRITATSLRPRRKRVVTAVRESGAAILLVAMGAPRQEIFIHPHRDELGVAVSPWAWEAASTCGRARWRALRDGPSA